MDFGRRPVARSPPAKRFLDIEAALWWTYRDELPKRGRRGGRWANNDLPSSSPMFRSVVTDAGPEDRNPRIPAAPGDRHPDALAIEAAVKGLASWAGHGFGDDIMTGMTSGLPLAIDPAPVAIEAIAAMPGAVTIHARIGARPKWSPERRRPHPLTDPKGGKPKVLRDETFVEVVDRQGRVHYEPIQCPPPPGAISYQAAVASPAIRAGLYREGTYCPLKWRPDPARLLQERAEWCAWRAAIDILAGELEGKLTALAVLLPAAPWCPWLGADDLHGRPGQPFAALREAPYRYLTKEQQAEQRRRAMRRALAARDADPTPPRHPTGGVAKRGNGST